MENTQASTSNNQLLTLEIPEIIETPTLALSAQSNNTATQIMRDNSGRITKGVAQDTNKNGTAGRPCEFCQNKEEIMKIVNEYVDKALTARKSQKPIMPYVEDLALELRKSDATLVNWAEKKTEKNEYEHPELFSAYSLLKTCQKLLLLKRTLGRYTPAGAMFQLTRNHGMIEISKQLLGNTENEPLQIEFIAEKPIQD